jgi:3-oxoacyl-[acyl-carrier protein] reductase
MHIDLRGKVAIVTGAGRGIGREIAGTLAGEGVTTAVTDVRQEYLDSVAEEFAAQGWTGRQYLCDVRDAERIAEVVGGVVRAFGRIDILVNNAGVALGAPVEALTEEAWDLNHDINLKGTFLMCRAVIPFMKRQRWGRILNAASFAAIVPIVGSAAYAASKAGVHYFTRALAGELGPWNVTVNCYAPGMIPTEMNRFAEAPPERQQRFLDTLTIRRWGQPRDVANLVVFLASDLADYITGTMVEVSGGKLATQIPRLAWEAAAAAGEIDFD